MIGLLNKKYDADAYHCVHFVVDAWRELTQHDLSQQFAPLLQPIASIDAARSVWESFEEIVLPVSPCVVLMRCGADTSHMGVFYDGKVFHMRETGPHGATVPQLRMEYPTMRFFKWKS